MHLFISHELCKAFTNRGNGFITSNGCEISDICERRGPDIVSGGNTFSCCISHTYEVDSRIWRSNPDPSFPDPGEREFGRVESNTVTYNMKFLGKWLNLKLPNTEVVQSTVYENNGLTMSPF